jgi:putative OPT family oligopeptide transporter
VFALVVGFICASIGGYMAGIVGSSCNPLSGITIGAILIVSLALLVLLGTQIDFKANAEMATSVAAVVILIGAVVAVAASFSCDNLQDLKAGHLLGSTPYKQQLTLIIGAIAGAIVVAPILQLLYEAYGIGGIFPREGMDATRSLTAPQATLMASVAKGIFTQTLDWPLVILGIGIGIVAILIDQLFLKHSNSGFRLSVLAIALGIYLPMDVTLPLIIGGIISFFAHHKVSSQKKALGAKYAEVEARTERRGLLLASGLIAGDALIGILLAIPFATYQSTDVLALVGPSFAEIATILGTLTFIIVGYYLYKLGSDVKVERGS